MPFRVVNATTIFMDYIYRIFRSFLDNFMVIFIDGILIYSKSREEHLYQVLQVLKEQQLYANLGKCEFCLEEAKFLRHVISKEKIIVNSSKVEALIEWKQPHAITKIRSFLGFVRYCMRFIKGFARIATSMKCLMKKN
ncbi:uncharacterized mitochondrial protein AtMg00860-like [Cicer arietinum]|uniref:Uncharacterized protein LOC113788233 n=1 Tax=Cicer arietinum TaxID=3827 RepID=A0A3Q7YEW6_CICAR|nr:uncharacterized protein LOC113788233 [Cicer arietinum]